MSKVLTYYSPTDLCIIRRTVIMPGPLPKYPIKLTPEQEVRLQHLSTCSTAPFAEVQRARLLLLAHHNPDWRNAGIARRVWWAPETGRQRRRRWWLTGEVREAVWTG